MNKISVPYNIIDNLPINRSINEPCLPTYEQLNKDIGLTWEFLAGAFFMDEKTLRRNKKAIPHRETDSKGTDEKWVDSIFNYCEKIVEEFAQKCEKTGQIGKGEEVRRKWGEKQADYYHGLEAIYAIDCISARTKSGEAEASMKKFAAEQKQKTGALLEAIKPDFEKIPFDKRKKIGYCCEEYIVLFQDPLIPYICIMTPEAKKKILNEMDKLTISLGEMRFVTMLKSWKCYCYAKILNYDTSRNNGEKILWNTFSRAVSTSLITYGSRASTGGTSTSPP